jgi:hypothetical protein
VRKAFKSTRGGVNAPGLALCFWEDGSFTTDIKIEVVLCRRLFRLRDNFFFYCKFPLVLYT